MKVRQAMFIKHICGTIFATYSCIFRHFWSGDQWKAYLLEEATWPLPGKGWNCGNHKVGQQGKDKIFSLFYNANKSSLRSLVSFNSLGCTKKWWEKLPNFFGHAQISMFWYWEWITINHDFLSRTIFEEIFNAFTLSKSFLHLYLCFILPSVPLFSAGQVLPASVPLFRGGGRGTSDGDDRQEEHSAGQEDHHVLCHLLRANRETGWCFGQSTNSSFRYFREGSNSVLIAWNSFHFV